MKQLVEFLATSLVDDKEAVRVDVTKSDRKSLYSLSVKQDDLGKVIGKKGRTVKAMRILLSALASMQGRQVSLQVLEPENPSQGSESLPPESALEPKPVSDTDEE